MSDLPPPPSPVEAGDILQTALVGPLVGGVVPLWTDAGRVLWQIDDLDAVRSVLGLGLLARTGRERDRYREVAMVASNRGTVMLMPRMTSSGTDGGDITLEARTFAATLTPADTVPPATNDEWLEFARWLSAVYASAARRSEYIVVEFGGWDFRDEPFAFAFAATDSDPPTNYLECSPRPDGASLWPEGNDPSGQSILAPIGPGTIEATGMLLADAIRTWAASPLDLSVSFGTSGHSPPAI